MYRFKVYHYSGALLHETLWPQGQELLGIEWQQYADNTFAEPKITKAKHEGIKSSQPEASKKAYTPPHLRLLKEGKNPEKYLPQPQTVPGLTATAPGNSSRKIWHRQYDLDNPIMRRCQGSGEQQQGQGQMVTSVVNNGHSSSSASSTRPNRRYRPYQHKRY